MNSIRISRPGALFGLSILCSAMVSAAPGEETVSEALLACAAMTDDVTRLECFDAELAELRAPSIVDDIVENPAVAPVALEQAASPISADPAPAAATELEQTASTPAAEKAPAEPVASEQAASPGADKARAEPVASEQATSQPVEAVVTAASNSVDEFGMTEKLASQSPDENRPVELIEITGTVTEVTKRPGGEHMVTLDNGQVWTEKRVEQGFRVKVGDTMTIKKGRMGGYRMVRGYHSSAAIRVE